MTGGRYIRGSGRKLKEFQKVPSSNKARRTAGILSTLFLFPPIIIFLWYTLHSMDGSITRSYNQFHMRGWWKSTKDIWPLPTLRSAKLLVIFAAFQSILLLFLPGDQYAGPLSPAGNRPYFKKNGFRAYMVTLVVYYLLWKEHYFNPAVVYECMGEMLSVMIVASYTISIFLYCKAHIHSSSEDWATTGNVLVDFFWGMELYPRLGKNFDIKDFLHCRFGMMAWVILIISCAIKQHTTEGRVSKSLGVTSLLMLAYTSKFFFTESEYWSSAEMVKDRAGFFFTWTSLVWNPFVRILVNVYLVSHPVPLGTGVALLISAAGLACTYVIYDCEQQRLLFRRSHGKCRIWGKIPNKIQSQHVTEHGEQKHLVMLTDGWWRVSRHFQYAPEIGVAFFWSLPALFRNGMPWFYVTFLTVALMDQAHADDKRCKYIYHKFWESYCKRVPYRIIPYLY
ncbi:unnamed protein product [Sphagnum troendelagicum]|uniref:7-dehydrocholesterol reductase n=1 Tax=Sphagnum troendelagicum TaxID=128251 RepID=A0ABP0TUR4_9BRYO